MAGKYKNIKRTPTFIAAFSEIRSHLKLSSPLAFLALPPATNTVLSTIERFPRSWPVKRKSIGGVECEFHLAIVGLAYRQLHIRYIVNSDDISFLVATWVDGQDEPDYTVGY